MAERAYIRGSGGKFAGANAKGTKVTYGRAGGFANAAFRARVAASRKAGGTGARGSTKGRGKKFLTQTERSAIGLGLVQAGAGAVVAGRSTSLAGKVVGVAFVASGAATAKRGLTTRATRRATRPRNPAGRKVRR